MATTFAPGTMPITRVESPIINCPNRKFQCAWGYTHRSFGPGNIDGYFWLKFINTACRLHSAMPHSKTPEVHYGTSFKGRSLPRYRKSK